MPYTHITFGGLKTALAQRLGDTGKVYWSDTELGLYIVEALRTWGLITGYWRDRGTFNTVANTGFYEISTLTNGGGTALLSRTVTDTSLASLIQYHLLEPATGTSWTGSEQFVYADLTGALQRRRDQLLLESGCVLTSSTQALAAGSNSFDLADTIVQVRNLRWTGALTGVDWAMLADDIGNQRNYDTGYLTTQGIPQTYSQSSDKPLRYTVAPPPSEPGTLRVLAIQSGAALDGSGIVLGVPDDMAWIIKWGAMADMLGREGPGQDLGRSYFCERRWRLGLAVAQLAGTVINTEIDGVALNSDSLNRLDQYDPNWYTNTGVPQFAADVRNYIALSPCPSGVHSVTLDVVRKADVPTADANLIQVGREYLDTILDYAEHLAAFKSGGQEFRHTFRAAQNFFGSAIRYNQRLAAQSPSLMELVRQATLDDYVEPRNRETARDSALNDATNEQSS